MPIICAGKVECMHCVRDMSNRKRTHYLKKKKQRNKEYQGLLKRLHPGQVRVLSGMFAQMDRDIADGVIKSAKEKRRALFKLFAGSGFTYPFSEFQRLRNNWSHAGYKRMKRRSVCL